MRGQKALRRRVHSMEQYRRSRERWEEIRRSEDRVTRATKDEELNGVRLQLREQASTFATKDFVQQLERTFEARLTAAIDTLNDEGTVGYRESEAARRSREETTKEILTNRQIATDSAASSRRWIIGLAITIAFSIVANAISLTVFISHLLTK